MGPASVAADIPTHPDRPRRRWGTLATVCLAVTVIVMDGSIVNVALPTLVQALGGTSNSQLQWIVDAYILSFAVFLLTASSSADRFGRRRLLTIGLVIFASVSVGAAFSKTPAQLIFWRAAMGVGAAMIFPATLAIITDAFPEPRLRRLAIALWAASSGLGVAIGPVAGGWLLTHYHWGSIFFINVPVIALVLIGTAICITESRDPDKPAFDFTGNALAIAALIALVWGLIEGPAKGWLSLEILGALTAAAVLLAIFFRWESRAPSPMLDLQLFHSRQFSGGCLAITTAFFGLFGFVFMVTQFFQFIHGYDALGAGIRTLPFAGFIVLGSAIAARLGTPLGPRRLAPGGLALMAIGFLWVTRDQPDTPYLLLVYQMAFLGVGLGMVSASATDAIMASLPTAKAGVGSSVNDTAREIGGMLGVAIMGSLFNATYRTSITDGFAGSPLPNAPPTRSAIPLASRSASSNRSTRSPGPSRRKPSERQPRMPSSSASTPAPCSRASRPSSGASRSTSSCPAPPQSLQVHSGFTGNTINRNTPPTGSPPRASRRVTNNDDEYEHPRNAHPAPAHPTRSERDRRRIHALALGAGQGHTDQGAPHPP